MPPTFIPNYINSSYLGNIIFIIINPCFLIIDAGFRIYTIGINFLCYPLSQSTLLNNYKVVHLVNNKSLLVPNTFVLIRGAKTIEYRSSGLLIVGYRVYIIKHVFNRPNSPSTQDLELTNIAIVKGFNTNIISEA